MKGAIKMNKAQEIKEKIKEFSLSVMPGEQDDGSFLSPAYLPVPIDPRDIVTQERNPNAQTDKSFAALQQSILNTGFTFPIIVAENEYYEPDSDMSQKPDLTDNGRQVEVRDPSVRKFFKYSVVDGSHRLSSILVNNEIRNREDCAIPCVVIRGKTSEELMSAEILHNSARGKHSMDSMKEIVSKLLDSGKQEDWISQNLFLDKETIGRYKMLSGLTSAFQDSESFSTNVWDPDKMRSDERKKNTEQNRLARAFVRRWRELARADGGKFDIPEDLNIIDAAENLGWDSRNPYVMPISVDTKTGEVIESGLVEVNGEKEEESESTEE